MHAAQFWVYVVTYVIAWSAIPACDRRALLSSVDRYALTAIVLSGAALVMLTYVLLFCDGPGGLLTTAAYSPWALASAALSAVAFLVYFGVLEERGMLFIVVLQPVLVVVQTLVAWLFLRETVDVWGWTGMALVVAGMGVIAVGQARAGGLLGSGG